MVLLEDVRHQRQFQAFEKFNSHPSQILHSCFLNRITESQTGRGWQGPLWVTQPNPLPKQGHPEPAAQHRVQVGLEYLQRRRLHSPPGQPGPGLRHPQREEVLPHVQMELPVLLFVPLAPDTANDFF